MISNFSQLFFNQITQIGPNSAANCAHQAKQHIKKNKLYHTVGISFAFVTQIDIHQEQQVTKYGPVNDTFTTGLDGVAYNQCHNRPWNYIIPAVHEVIGNNTY